MPRQAVATLFLEEPDKQYVLVIKFQQSPGGVQARLMNVFNATTTEEVEQNEWPSQARFQELLETHSWAYDNDPDRANRSQTNGLIRERQQLNNLPEDETDGPNDLWSMN